MKKEINFVLDRNLSKLNSEVESLIYSIKHPLAGEKVSIITHFTRALIRAYHSQNKEKYHKAAETETIAVSTHDVQPPQQMLDLRSNEFSLLELERSMDEETTNLNPLNFEFEEPKKELPKPKVEERVEEPKVVEIPEEKVTLIQSKITDEELAFAKVKGLFYVVHESDLTPEEIMVLNSLKPILECKEELFQNKEKFIKSMNKIARKNKISRDSLSPSKLRYFLIKHIINFGLIDPIMHDPKVSKIVCDGPNLKLKVYRNGDELITNLEYSSEQQLNEFLKHIAKKASKKLTPEETTFDAEFDNFIFHVTMGSFGLPSKFVLERIV